MISSAAVATLLHWLEQHVGHAGRTGGIKAVRGLVGHDDGRGQQQQREAPTRQARPFPQTLLFATLY